MDAIIQTVMDFVQNNLVIVCVAGGVLALLPFIIGLITGLRRSFYRLITCIIFFVVLLLTAPAVSNWLYNLDVGGLISDILPDGFSGNSLKEIANNYVGNYVALEEAQLVIVDELVCVVIRFLYVTVLALVLNLVYWLLTTIIYAIFFKKKKKKDENGKRIKFKKHRFLGGLVNGFKFILVIVTVAVILVSGPLEIATSFLTAYNNEEVKDDLDELFNQFGVGEIIAQVDSYYPAFIRNLYVPAEGEDTKDKFSIFGLINDQIFTIKINDQEIDLITEVDGLFTLTEDFLTLYNGFTAEEKTIDFGAIANICYYFEDSKLIQTLLPMGADFAVNLDAVKDIANQYGVDASCISDVEWEGTFKALGDISKLVGEMANDLEYVTAEPNGAQIHRMYQEEEPTPSADPNKLMLIDLTKIDKEKVSTLFTLLSNISLITVLMDEAIKVGVQLPAVKEKLGDLELELDNLVWKDEIVNLGNVVNAFLDVGFKCVNDIMGDFKKTLNNLSFGSVTVEDDLGGLGKLFDALFASRFVDQLFGVAMEKVVLPMIPEDYQGMFDFDAIEDKGWPNEFNDLLRIFKDAKGVDNVFFKEDGKLNFEIIKNVKPETLLKSAIIPDAVISLLVDAKNGTGVLASVKDVLVIPDNLNDKNSEAWKIIAPAYYVVTEDFKANNKEYAKYTRVSLDEYLTLGDKQSLCKLNNKITGGEIYNLFDVLPDLLDIVDLGSLGGEGGSPIALNNQTLKKLTKKNSSGSSTVTKLSSSIIVRATISKFITEMGGDLIVVPTSVTEEVLVDGVTKYVVKSEELESVFDGLVKLEIMKDKYVVAVAFNDYVVDQVLTIAQYEALTDEEKKNITVSSDISVGVGIIDKLEEYDYVCNTEVNDYKVGDVITKAEYEALDDEIKAKFAQNHMVQDYLFGDGQDLEGSATLVATISNLLTDMGGDMLKIPTEGEGKVVDTGYTDISGNPIQYMIHASELRSVVRAINALGIVEKKYAIQETFVYNEHTYSELTSISEAEYLTLPIEFQAKCEEEIKLNASMGLVSNLAGNDNNGNPNMDYITGVNGSKILYATICDIILEQAKDNDAMLVVPQDSIGTVGQYKVIISTDLNALVVGIDSLGLIKEYQCTSSVGSYTSGTIIPKSEYELLDDETKTHFNKINGEIQAGIDIVSQLLYLTSDDQRRLDKVTGSDILSATISKFVLENASSITIPDTVKTSIQRYSETGAVSFNVITSAELNELLVTLCELEIVENGSINASIDLINKIDGQYVYKPGLETKEVVEDKDELYVIDHINASLIMRATISEKIFEQSSTIDVLDVVTEDIGTTKLIIGEELKNLIAAINALGIIQGGAVADINSIAGTILTDSEKQAKIIDSVILRATLTNKVASTGSLDVPYDAIDMSYNGNIIDIEAYKQLSSAQQALCSTTFVTVNNTNVMLMSEDELTALFNSLNLLGISNFEGVNVSFTSIQVLLNNNQLDDLFECRTIWQKTSALCTETGSGSDLFTLPTYGQDSYQVYVNTNNNANLSNTVYATILTEPKQADYELTTVYSYDRDILFADTYKRLTVKEIESILNLITLLGDGGDNFNVDASAFTSIYTDTTKRSQLATIMTESGILLQNINKLFGNAITNATTGTAFESYTSAIPAKIAAISTDDITLWAKYENDDYDHVTEMVNTSFAYVTDNQLDRLLAGLNALTSITAPEQILNDKNTVLAIDNSYCLRSLLSSLEYTAGQPILAYYEVTTAFLTYEVGDIISSAEYMLVSSFATGNVVQHAYNANDSYTDRVTNCLDVIYSLIPTA